MPISSDFEYLGCLQFGNICKKKYELLSPDINLVKPSATVNTVLNSCPERNVESNPMNFITPKDSRKTCKNDHRRRFSPEIENLSCLRYTSTFCVLSSITHLFSYSNFRACMKFCDGDKTISEQEWLPFIFYLFSIKPNKHWSYEQNMNKWVMIGVIQTCMSYELFMIY